MYIAIYYIYEEGITLFPVYQRNPGFCDSLFHACTYTKTNPLSRVPYKSPLS
jgi:hypothetical protein